MTVESGPTEFVRGLSLLIVLLLTLALSVWADTPLAAFERALEEARYEDAGKLAEALPQGPARQLP